MVIYPFKKKSSFITVKTQSETFHQIPLSQLSHSGHCDPWGLIKIIVTMHKSEGYASDVYS